MPTVDESSGMNAALTDGLRELSLDQVVTFTEYVRHVLPLDGFLFWLKTQSTQIRGSLHYVATKRQSEDETAGINQVVFTTATEIQNFNEIGPLRLLVGEIDGIRFAFSQQQNFYASAGLFHYVGEALNPALATQLIDVGMEPSDDTLIVSNSLPAWLTLRNYNPIWLQPANPGITLYPSFAIPANLTPPYGSVHIEPSKTFAIQAFPAFTNRMRHWQLASDMVRITLYGLTNNDALDFQDLIVNYSQDTDDFGIQNMPIVQDDKRTQSEFGILAMKKTIDVQVSYYQNRMNDLARKLILHANFTIYPQELVA